MVSDRKEQQAEEQQSHLSEEKTGNFLQRL